MLFRSALADSRWGTRALKLAEKLPIDHPDVKVFETLEARFIKEFNDTKERARLFLLQGKRALAVQLLDELLRKQFAEADSCLAALEKKAASLPVKNEIKK